MQKPGAFSGEGRGALCRPTRVWILALPCSNKQMWKSELTSPASVVFPRNQPLGAGWGLGRPGTSEVGPSAPSTQPPRQRP